MRQIILFIATAVLGTACFAQDASDSSDKTSFPAMAWQSKSSSEPVTIQNGAGLPIVILINLNKDSGSANIKNCGTVTKIEAGNSAICTTNDDSNPVTITSDSSTHSASGIYQIKQR
jgi:hypothetical protein